MTNISIEPEQRKTVTPVTPPDSRPDGYDSQNEDEDKEQKLNDTITLFQGLNDAKDMKLKKK